jgi:hypothetical protein
MSEPACSSRYRSAVAKHRRLEARRVRHLIPALMALCLLSVAGTPALAGPVAPASAGAPVAAPSSASPGDEDLTTPEAVAGLQKVPGVILDGVSCFSKQCIAVGTGRRNHGAFVVITDGVPGPVEKVRGTFSLTSVDCVSTTTCYAVGTDPYVNPEGISTIGGAVVTISNGNLASVDGLGVPNTGLETPGEMFLYGIGCSGTSACVATGFTSAIAGFAVTVSNGVPDDNLVRTGPLSTNGAECVSGGRCMINAGMIMGFGHGEAEFGWDWAATIDAKGHLLLGRAENHAERRYVPRERPRVLPHRGISREGRCRRHGRRSDHCPQRQRAGHEFPQRCLVRQRVLVHRDGPEHLG